MSPDLEGLSPMLERRLEFGADPVPYRYGVDCTAELVESLVDGVAPAEGILFVVDRQAKNHAEPVIELLSRSVRVEPYVLDATEGHKSLDSVQAIMEFAVEARLSRSTAVVAMGGGVVGNVAGLAAALLYRGTPLVHLPTTPVAAFDAVISLKQGVNLRSGKNLCGTYLTPAMILCDLRWLTSVPRSNLLTGLAEMAKNVLITAPDREDAFVHAIGVLGTDPIEALHGMLEIGIEAKAPFVRQDPREKGAAIIFEYGHTVGHAVEFTSGGAVGHGEAVAWGMLVAAEVSRVLHGLDAETLDTHRRLTSLLGLPDPAERFGTFDLAAVRARVTSDNKRGYAPCRSDEVPMVLLQGLGRPMAGDGGHPLVAVPEPVVAQAVDTVFLARAHR